MTNPYSAKYLTAFQYFSEACKEHHNITVCFGSNEEIAFKDFYNYVSTKAEDLFLEKRSSELVDYINTKLQGADVSTSLVLKSNDSRMNLIYFKLKTKTFDIVIRLPNGIFKRITKKYEIPDETEIDYKKITQAVRANWVHYTDAILLRDINRHCESVLLSIHDCLLVDMLYVCEFIDIANQCASYPAFGDM